MKNDIPRLLIVAAEMLFSKDFMTECSKKLYINWKDIYKYYHCIYHFDIPDKEFIQLFDTVMMRWSKAPNGVKYANALKTLNKIIGNEFIANADINSWGEYKYKRSVVFKSKSILSYLLLYKAQVSLDYDNSFELSKHLQGQLEKIFYKGWSMVNYMLDILFKLMNMYKPLIGGRDLLLSIKRTMRLLTSFELKMLYYNTCSRYMNDIDLLKLYDMLFYVDEKSNVVLMDEVCKIYCRVALVEEHPEKLLKDTIKWTDVPRFVFQKIISAQEAECPICYIENLKLLPFSCGHSFCVSCFLKLNKRCPYRCGRTGVEHVSEPIISDNGSP